MLRKALFSALALASSLALCAAKEIEFTYKSSFDSTEQTAAGYVPDSCDNKTPLPLVIVAHGMGCDKKQAKGLGYYETAEKENFIVICPELHGLNSPGQTSLAAIPAQRDILDAIDYAFKNYNINKRRVYITGRSMGGMMAMLMALKHPDIFAAAVAGQGVYDLKYWYGNSLPFFKKPILAEMKTPPAPDNDFDYLRRSPISFAQNAPYTAIFMWHGTNDKWVPTVLSEMMFDELKKYNKYQAPVSYRNASSHCELNFPASWEWEQLKTYENISDSASQISSRFFDSLDVIVDEDGSMFYLVFELENKNAFGRIKAEIMDSVLTITTENIAKLTVDENKLPLKLKSTKINKK
ncbi:MAG: hypothetical protein A2X49_06415 [Lentisphaerae bacterium GWF2_52_8]|nr:MAG: hypothetical protein A2X49_06415 [Lentisphaerae bacterium GWF2_52_8]